MKCGEMTIDVLPNSNNDSTASVGNGEVQNIQLESIITDTDKLWGGVAWSCKVMYGGGNLNNKLNDDMTHKK